jgi:hypothetical protein
LDSAGEEAVEEQAAAAGGAFMPKNELMRTGAQGGFGEAEMSFGQPLGNAFG